MVYFGFQTHSLIPTFNPTTPRASTKAPAPCESPSLADDLALTNPPPCDSRDCKYCSRILLISTPLLASWVVDQNAQASYLNFPHLAACRSLLCHEPQLGRVDRPAWRETSAVMPKPSLLSQNPRSASIACCGSTTRVTS